MPLHFRKINGLSLKMFSDPLDTKRQGLLHGSCRSIDLEIYHWMESLNDFEYWLWVNSHVEERGGVGLKYEVTSTTEKFHLNKRGFCSYYKILREFFVVIEALLLPLSIKHFLPKTSLDVWLRLRSQNYNKKLGQRKHWEINLLVCVRIVILPWH